MHGIGSKGTLNIPLILFSFSNTLQESGGIDLIFHTNTESGKTNDIESDSHINISFINSSGEWASISGKASILTDRAIVKKYYSSALKAWLGDLGDGKHDGGPEDPRIGVIKVEAKTATYALVKKSAVSRMAEVAQGVVTGKAASVNKLRELSEQEIETWRSSNKMVQ
jgi:general stress protein 26